MLSPAEHALISLAQSGSSSAFDELILPIRPKLLSYALKLTNGQREDAEDLTQLTLLKGWMKLSTFRAESRLNSWLTRILIREFLMSKRKLTTIERGRPNPLDFSTSLDGDIDDGDRAMTWGQWGVRDPVQSFLPSRLAMISAISNLPDSMREIFLLKFVYGYEHHEIERMGRQTVGGSKAMVYRARVRLQSQLGK